MRKFPTGLESLSIVRGQGAYCWDSEGNKYIDFICGYGPLVLGHANAQVNKAVSQQLGQGLLFPTSSPPLQELTSVLCSLFPGSNNCHFTKTGSEAIAAAVRLVRAFTGKSMIIKCGFHGWHDPFVVPYVPWHQYEVDLNETRPVYGIPEDGTQTLILIWDGEDIKQLKELYQKHQGSVAALLLDPVQLRDPIAENLKQISDLTRNEGALFVLDEAKTGFRVSLTGVQGLYGIHADLTILSKALANGFPIAAVIGPAEILKLARGAKLKGTYNTELVSVVAAIATISILKQPDSIPRLNHLGQRMIDGLNHVFDRIGLGGDVLAVPYRWPCMPYIWFRTKSERAIRLKSLLYQRVIKRGVLLLPNHMNYVCLAHTTADVEEAIQVVEEILNDLSKDV